MFKILEDLEENLEEKKAIRSHMVNIFIEETTNRIINTNQFLNTKKTDVHGRVDSQKYESKVIAHIRDIVNNHLFFKENNLTFHEDETNSQSFDFKIIHVSLGEFYFNVKNPNYNVGNGSTINKNKDNSSGKVAMLYTLTGEWHTNNRDSYFEEQFIAAEQKSHLEMGDYIYLIFFKDKPEESYGIGMRELDLLNRKVCVPREKNNYPFQINYALAGKHRIQTTPKEFYDNCRAILSKAISKENRGKVFRSKIDVEAEANRYDTYSFEIQENIEVEV